MKRIIVTGGLGFIGSNLIDLLLKKNFEVRVLDNLSGGRIKNLSKHKKSKRLKFKNLDINKMKLNEPFFKNANFIFHLAGKGDIVPSIENPLSYMMTNIIGTTKVLENCRGKQIRKIKVFIPSSWGSGTHLRVLTHTPLEKRIYKAPESFLPLGKLNHNLGSDFQSAGSPGLAPDDHLSGNPLLEQLDV